MRYAAWGTLPEIVFFTTLSIKNMAELNQNNMLQTAATVAGGALLFSPLVVSILHGAAGIAVVGLGLFAAGSLIGTVGEALSDGSKSREQEEDNPFV